MKRKGKRSIKFPSPLCVCLVLTLAVLIVLIEPAKQVEAEGYKVDDIRELLIGIGYERKTWQVPEEKEAEIQREYSRIKRDNMYTKKVEKGKEIDIQTKVEEKRKELEEEEYRVEEELKKLMREEEEVEGIQRAIIRLNAIQVEKRNLLTRTELEVEYKENKWEAEYTKMKRLDKEIKKEKELGELGSRMCSPVSTGFILTGISEWKYEKGKREKEKLIKLYGVEGTKVYAQWNGEVSKITKEKEGAYKITIDHGSGLVTEYTNLKKVKVEKGKIKQGEEIGELGKIKQGEEIELKLQIRLEGKQIEPLYLYGKRGLQALQAYVSENTEYSGAEWELERLLREEPQKENPGVKKGKNTKRSISIYDIIEKREKELDE